MIYVVSSYTYDGFGKVMFGLIGYYSGNVDVIPSQNLLIIAKRNCQAEQIQLAISLHFLTLERSNYAQSLLLDKCYKTCIP